MSFSELKELLQEDLFRYSGKLGLTTFLRTWRYEAGLRLTLLMRVCRFLHQSKFTRFSFYYPVAFFYHRACIRHGVHINFMTEIGGGLYLPHALNIVVNRHCKIGSNCNLSQGVTLGVSQRGKRRGTPTIGNKVYLAPGAIVFGSVFVGNEVAIGANCVVTKDIQDKAVVVGIPGEVISFKGVEGYIDHVLTSPQEIVHRSKADLPEIP